MNSFLNSFFIFGCAGSSLLCVGFLWLGCVGTMLCCGAWTSHCGGFFSFRARALDSQASVVTACGPSGCGTWTFIAHGMWNLPRPGIKHMSTALAGGLLFIALRGKSPTFKSKQTGLFHRKIALCTLPSLYHGFSHFATASLVLSTQTSLAFQS